MTQRLAYLAIGLAAIVSACRRAADSRHSYPARFGFGTPASPSQIAAIDIDVMPDGTGLPPGSGTAGEGARVYAAKCASCHGATGSEGPMDKLVGRMPNDRFPFGNDASTTPLRTIGSYWPYPTTIFDYVRRAMPQSAPGSLSSDEVYALTAFLLYRNGIIDSALAMNAASLPTVHMPARSRFVSDDREQFKEVR